MKRKRILLFGVFLLQGLALAAESASAMAATTPDRKLANTLEALAETAGDDIQQLSGEDMGALSALVGSTSAFNESDQLTSAVLKKSIEEAFLTPRLNVESMRVLLESALRNQNPVRDEMTALGVLMLPYMHQAGLCSGDPWSEQGVECGFMQPATGGIAEMTVIDNQAGTQREMPSVPEGSNLHNVISVGEHTCVAPAFRANGAGQPNVDELVSELNWDGCYRLNYGWGYYLRYRFGVFTGIEIWGEVYGAANFQLGASLSDNAFGVAPVGMSCGWGCLWRLIGCAIRGDDIMACALASVRREYYYLRPSSTIRHAIRASCGVAPVDYETRPTWLALQNGYLRMPQGLGFGTSFQYGGGALHDVTGGHLYPRPSYADLDNPDWLEWTHTMSYVRAWHNNVVFAGVESANASALDIARGACRGAVSDGGEPRSGDVFWYWHGRQYNSSIFKHRLPEIRVVASVRSGHDPIVCDPVAVIDTP